jgi:hypothetical protein
MQQTRSLIPTEYKKFTKVTTYINWILHTTNLGPMNFDLQF